MGKTLKAVLQDLLVDKCRVKKDMKRTHTFCDSGSASGHVNLWKIHRLERSIEITQANPFILQICFGTRHLINTYQRIILGSER